MVAKSQIEGPIFLGLFYWTTVRPANQHENQVSVAEMRMLRTCVG